MNPANHFSWCLRKGIGKADVELARLTRCKDLQETIIVFIISREEIESRNISRLLFIFDVKGKREEMRSLFGKYIFAIMGYENSTEELFEIPDVRDYFTYLKRFPIWLAFGNLASDTIKMIAACSMPNLRVVKRKRRRHSLLIFINEDLLQFLVEGAACLKAAHKLAGISAKLSKKKLTQAIDSVQPDWDV